MARLGLATRGVAAAVLIAVIGASTLADAFPRQPAVDAQHYVWRLSFSENLEELSGEATVDLLFTQNGAAEFFLDLTSPTANNHGMTVSAVTSGGKPLTFNHSNNQLRITLAEPSKAGQKQQFTIVYKGIADAGLHIGDNRHGDRVLFSENWPNRARQWLPCIDHPYDKATSEMIVTAPARFQVISNGLKLDEKETDGKRLTHWKQSVPIATWLNAVGVANFGMTETGKVLGIQQSVWVYPQEKETLTAPIEDAGRKAIEFFSDYVGPFAYEKLAHVQAFGIGGGTEHASAIFYGDGSLNPQRLAGLVAHETAHQWFGNCVTESDWDDVWLSEGFATYFTLMYTEKYQGRDAFLAGVRRSRDTVLRANPQLPVIHNKVADGRRILNNMVYQKGGWTLHMLRGLIGEDAFHAGIRNYYKTYFNGSASTDGLRKIMETAAGKKQGELQWFFDQWLKRAGNPRVEGTWRFDAPSKKLVIELAQTQQGETYRLPIEIAVTTGGATAIKKIEMTEGKYSLEIPTDIEPVEVTLDPNTWVLMTASFAKQP